MTSPDPYVRVTDYLESQQARGLLWFMVNKLEYFVISIYLECSAKGESEYISVLSRRK